MQDDEKEKIAEILEESRRLKKDIRWCSIICLLMTISNFLEGHLISKMYNLFFGGRNLLDVVINVLCNIIG